MTLPKFTIDGWNGTYEAIAYGPTWNGWATPVVSRETLEQIVATEDDFTVQFDSDGTALLIDNGWEDSEYDEITLRLTDSGGYNLFHLGWCFDTVDCDTNAPADA